MRSWHTFTLFLGLAGAILLATGACDAVLGLGDYYLADGGAGGQGASGAAGGSAGAGGQSNCSGSDPQGAHCDPDACSCEAALLCDADYSICCDRVCGGLCESCNLDGLEGTCTPIPFGEPDAQAECDSDSTCDGVDGCQWSSLVATPGNQRVQAIDANNGYFAVAGLYESGFTLAGQTVLDPVGDADIFVVTFGPGFSLSHVFTIEATLVESIAAVSIVDEDTIYVAGTLFDTGTIAGNNVSGDAATMLDPFVLRVTSGSALTGMVLNSTGDQRANDVAVGGAGVALVGSTTASMPDPCFGGGANVTSEDAFMAWLDIGSSSTCTFGTIWGTLKEDRATGVDVDGAGHVLVSGDYTVNAGLLTFRDAPLALGSAYDEVSQHTDVFVAKIVPTINPPGGTEWMVGLAGRDYGAVGNDKSPDTSSDVKLTSTGNVIVAGVHSGSSFELVPNGGEPVPMESNLDSASDLRPFLVALDGATGGYLSSHSFSNPKVEQTIHRARLKLSLQEDDTVVIGGEFRGTADFGGGEVPEGGTLSDRHVFVAKISDDLTNLLMLRYHEVVTTYDLDTDVAALDTRNVAMLAVGLNGTLHVQEGPTVDTNDYDALFLSYLQ